MCPWHIGTINPPWWARRQVNAMFGALGSTYPSDMSQRGGQLVMFSELQIIPFSGSSLILVHTPCDGKF
jgi:hypothetical protein